MIIEDAIYGKITITTPVIIDIINSAPLQRLKKINQYGSVSYIQPFLTTTRFEHSVGTWYLSSLFDRSIEEQIASLIHDTPHTAFSHVIDFVMKNKEHEYHDKFIKDIILESEIPGILKKYGVSLGNVFNKEAFPLLDNKIPDISFDRWDYFMRDGFTFGFLSQETIDLFLGAILEKDEKFYFTDIRIASQFAILFLSCSRLFWLAPTSHGSYFLLAKAMKIALTKKIITHKDLFTTDKDLLQKLRASSDKQIQFYLGRLTVGHEFEYATKKDAEFYGPNKPRFVDPWVEVNGTLHKLSNLLPNIGEYFKEFKQRYQMIGVKPVKAS